MKKNNIWTRIMLGMLFLMMFILGGCGNKAASGDELTGDLTRAQYVGLLCEKFGFSFAEAESTYFSDVADSEPYYEEIQACAQWGVLDNADEFKPSEDTDLEFAINTAVKAIELSRLDKAEVNYDENNLMDFYTNNIAAIDVSDPSAKADAVVCRQIIDYAYNYKYQMELPQVCKMELVDGVKTAESDISLNADGKTGIIVGEHDYKTGDVVYIPATDTELAMGLKIDSIDGNEFSYSVASLSDVYSELYISGTYQGKVMSVTTGMGDVVVAYGNPASDEKFAEILEAACPSYYDNFVMMDTANSVEAELDSGSDHILFTVKADDEGKTEDGAKYESHGEFTIGIQNIEVSPSYEHEKFKVFRPTEAGVEVSFDTIVSGSVDGHIGKTIPLGDADIMLYGPFSMRLSLTAYIGADGSVKITHTTKNTASVCWKKGSGLQKSFESETSKDIEAEVTLTAEVTAKADLRVGFRVFGQDISESMVNLEVTTGIVAIAKADVDLLGENPACIDLYMYVPLRWGANQQSCLLTAINDDLKYKDTKWDSENSPYTWNMHFEDGKLVDACSRKEAEKVEVSTVSDNGAPFDEFELFEFEPLEFGVISLVKYVMSIEPEQSMEIGINSVPEGYSESDLIYYSEDESICKVDSNGNVTGVDVGSTAVYVETSDGVYKSAIAVTVVGDYHVDGFEEL